MFWPCETRTSTCRSFATISSGLYRFLAIAVLLDVKDIPQVGPLQWGWITPERVIYTADALSSEQIQNSILAYVTQLLRKLRRSGANKPRKLRRNGANKPKCERATLPWLPKATENSTTTVTLTRLSGSPARPFGSIPTALTPSPSGAPLI